MKAWTTEPYVGSTRDSTGVSYVIYFTGCVIKCKGCHNPELQDKEYGKQIDTQTIKDQLEKSKIIDTVVFQGGEPFLQITAMRDIAMFAQSLGLRVWVYSGYTYEQILEKFAIGITASELLDPFDVMVCGPYKEELAREEYTFLASDNQIIMAKVKTNLMGVDMFGTLHFRPIEFWAQKTEEEIIEMDKNWGDMIDK